MNLLSRTVRSREELEDLPPPLAARFRPPTGKRRLLEVLHRHGMEAAARAGRPDKPPPLTFSEAGRLAGLSRSSVHSYRRQLSDEGLLVVEDEDATPAPDPGAVQADEVEDASSDSAPLGRLALDPQAAYALAIDFGRLHETRVILVDLFGEKVGKPWRSEEDLLPAEDPYEALERARQGIEQVLKPLDLTIGELPDWDKLVGVGISLPGPVRHHRLVGRPEETGPWARENAAEDLEPVLGLPKSKFVSAGDTILSALDEWVRGRQLTSHSLYVKWSAALRATLVVGGRLYVGAGGVAGELAHGWTDGINEDSVRELGIEPCPTCKQITCVHALGDLRMLSRLADPTASYVLRATDIAPMIEGNDGLKRAIEMAAFAVNRAVEPYVAALNPDRLILGGALGSRVFPDVWNILRANAGWNVIPDADWNVPPDGSSDRPKPAASSPIARAHWRAADRRELTPLYGAAINVLLHRAVEHLLYEDRSQM